MDQAGPIDLMPLIYVIGGYFALQVLLNLGGRELLRRTHATLWQALILTFWFGVANACFFIAAAAAFLALSYAPPLRAALPPSPWWLAAGPPLGVGLWMATVLMRNYGIALFGRGDLVAAEDAILRLPLPRAYQALGVFNLAVLQPAGRELFLRGVFLPAVVADLGWGWALAATLVVEFLLRLNIVWALMTLTYVLAMCLLYYVTGAPWCGLVAAGVAGLLHAVALTTLGTRAAEPGEQAGGGDATVPEPSPPEEQP